MQPSKTEVAAIGVEYHTSSHAYLSRAKSCIASSDPHAMFYAALELRCCIEARQDEYLEAQHRYRRSMARSWQVGKKAKELDRIFSQEKISKVTLISSQGPPLTVYHVPINSGLVRNADRLGNYLHVVTYKEVGDPWWLDFNALLIATYRSAWLACRGNLLCPPFQHKDGTTSIAIELDVGQEPQFDWKAFGTPGKTIIAKIDYPDAPPSDWVCDI